MKGFEEYRNSSLQKLQKADITFYLYNDGKMEIVKNRYNGKIGSIEGNERIKVLVEILANITFNNTCVIFQEALKKKIYKVLEGEEYDKI